MANTADGTTLEKELVTTDAGDHDRFAHYFRGDELQLAYFDGVEIQALCGKRDVPTRDHTKYPVCGTCKEIYEKFPAGDDE